MGGVILYQSALIKENLVFLTSCFGHLMEKSSSWNVQPIGEESKSRKGDKKLLPHIVDINKSNTQCTVEWKYTG